MMIHFLLLPSDLIVADWKLYCELLKASISVLDLISQLVHSLLEISKPLEPLPDFDHSKLDDSPWVPFEATETFSWQQINRSTYDGVLEWLSRFSLRDDARVIAMDLQSHRNIGQGSSAVSNILRKLTHPFLRFSSFRFRWSSVRIDASPNWKTGSISTPYSHIRP